MRQVAVLTKRENEVLAHAQAQHARMGWMITASREAPKRICDSLVRKDFLAPLHHPVELCDDDGFKAFRKDGRERFLRGQGYQLTVQGLNWPTEEKI